MRSQAGRQSKELASQLAAVVMQNSAANLSSIRVKLIQASSLQQQDLKYKLLAALYRIGFVIFSGCCGNNCHLLVFSVPFCDVIDHFPNIHFTSKLQNSRLGVIYLLSLLQNLSQTFPSSCSEEF